MRQVCHDSADHRNLWRIENEPVPDGGGCDGLKVHGCYNAVMRISAKFTYDDLQLIPPDRNRYEIVEGDLLVTAFTRHPSSDDCGQPVRQAVAPCPQAPVGRRFRGAV